MTAADARVRSRVTASASTKASRPNGTRRSASCSARYCASAFACGFLHHRDDLVDAGRAGQSVDAHDEGAVFHRSAPIDRRLRAFVDECRLACHGRFVYLCLSFEHGTIDREARPRAHMQAIAQTHLVEAHLHFGAIGTHDPHRISPHEQAVLQSYARARIHVVLREPETCSKNMILPADVNSRCTMAVAIATASSTSTVTLPESSARRPRTK